MHMNEVTFWDAVSHKASFIARLLAEIPHEWTLDLCRFSAEMAFVRADFDESFLHALATTLIARWSRGGTYYKGCGARV